MTIINETTISRRIFSSETLGARCSQRAFGKQRIEMKWAICQKHAGSDAHPGTLLRFACKDRKPARKIYSLCSRRASILGRRGRGKGYSDFSADGAK
jgi:hypothetical protein